MIFENNQIDLEQLPQIETVDFHLLDKAYLKVSYIGNAIFFAFLLIGPLISIVIIDQAAYAFLKILLPSLWLLLMLFSFWITGAGFKLKGYALRDKDILYRSGILFRSVTTIPFNRVQHCEIKEGPIERFFGLKTLEVYTAGGESSDLSIPGLRGDTAQQLKTFIVKNTSDDGSIGA